MKTREVLIVLGVVVGLLLPASVFAQCPPGYPIDCGNGFCCPAALPICCNMYLTCCPAGTATCCPDGCCPPDYPICGANRTCLGSGGPCSGANEADGEAVMQEKIESVPAIEAEGAEEE